MRKPITSLYKDSLGLLTDLYQLTMAYGYWKSGTAEKEAVFELSFRKNPFDGGFAIVCGLTHIIDFLTRVRFEEDDLEYLSSLTGHDGEPLFEEGFLSYLRALEFKCDLDAVPEGTVVFAHEPVVRVKGPIIVGQLLESVLLNIVNFQTLIATKAARVRLAAGDSAVLEFGLRRAQGTDGALSASWAAYVGGCDATSNVLAGKIYGIPVRGTHAHSWVMSFDDELGSFQTYARAMPNNCVFLVDTYDTLEGVKHAIEVGKWLKANGHELLGVRLDSGDLAYLSIEARKMLDEQGFHSAEIYASNDLNEHIIESLNDQGARVGVWGVGTQLITAFDQPALGGVYKLCAVRDAGPRSKWQYKIKLSEQVAKINNPGILQVRRFFAQDGDSEYYLGDMIYDEQSPPGKRLSIVDPVDFTRRKVVPEGAGFEDLLVPVARDGEIVYPAKTPDEIRAYSRHVLSRFHPGIKRLLNPHQYPVGLEQSLHKLKTRLILEARQFKDDELANVSS